MKLIVSKHGNTHRNVFNIASVFAGIGNLPTEMEIRNPMQYGRYWWREGNKIHLYSISNDWWAWITEETDESMTIQITYRYDKGGVSDAIMQAIGLLFQNNGVEIIEQ